MASLRTIVCVFAIFGAVTALFPPLECNRELIGNVQYQPFSTVFPDVKEGDKIEIPCGTAVELDVYNLPPLRGLTINGYFRVPHNKGQFNILSEWILVQGMFQAGHRSVHFREGSGLSITLAHSDVNPLVFHRDGVDFDFGTKAFAVVGGRLLLHGLPGGHVCKDQTWQKLKLTARAGSNILAVNQDVTGCWFTGNRVVVSSTSTNFREREHKTIMGMISRVDEQGNTYTSLILDSPLEFDHTGLDMGFQARDGTWVTEEAEVGLLTRSITISGEINPHEGATMGGHFVIHETAVVNTIFGVEIFSMGQQGTMGKYPSHFHMCENIEGSSFVANSVHDTMQRGLVIHGSDNLLVEYNVFSNILGHGILLEDGAEVGNIIRKNVGFHNDSPQNLIHIDGVPETDGRPAMFWITNPDNTFEDNIASGSGFSGFWFELFDSVRGLAFERYEHVRDVVPEKVPLRSFKGNEAHSNRSHGLRTYPSGYRPLEVAKMQDLKMWKNAFGIFLHNSRNILVENSILVDNLELGLDFNVVLGCALKNSVVIGKSIMGEKCPIYGAVRNSGTVREDGSSGNRMENVSLDMYGECKEPVISQRVDDFEIEGVVSGSTALVNVVSFDRDQKLIDLDHGVTSTDEKWKYAAYQIVGGNLMEGKAGYLVPNLPIMLNAEGDSSKCSDVSAQTKFCVSSCYRTVRISFPCIAHETYSIRITRLTDDVVETLAEREFTGTTAEFYINLRSEYEYKVELLLSQGMEHPKRIQVGYADGEKACVGAVKLLFPNENHMWKNFNSNAFISRKPCPIGGIVVAEDFAMYYDKCLQGKLYRAIELPELPLREWRHLTLDVDTNAGSPKADVCDKPVTRCLAVDKFATWNYFEQGIEPQGFRTTSQDDSNWKSGEGKFGYGRDDVTTELQGTHRAYYFRKNINLGGDISCYQTDSALMSISYGDGLIVYVNGDEIFRKNMPDGLVDGTTLANAHGTVGWYEPNVVDTVLSMLREGDNVIEVEVHRFAKDTARTLRMVFDMQLELALENSCMSGF